MRLDEKKNKMQKLIFREIVFTYFLVATSERLPIFLRIASILSLSIVIRLI